ncbi:transglycosylase SLT domain-containing protein [Nocardia sp. KC 131]|uniref:transglycosylase SLT domain-containing protein n=1 Tax=Nocardia arseniciresistens TaxID=3392119 RepID=UPI00398F1C2F
MPDRRFFSSHRPSLREGFTIAVAAAGLIAVAASSAVSVADDSVPSRIAMVAEQQPAPAAEQVSEAVSMPELPALPALPALPELPPLPSLPPPPAPAYENNLNGWIQQSLDIMHSKGIPGSYDGIYRNVMRESGGDPQAINLWDSNAAAGIPSKGLLQVIDPTFNAFHVDGTVFDIWDPVANIVAACNYAANRYGSMDYVNSAY